jgi:hypothetical protein
MIRFLSAIVAFAGVATLVAGSLARAADIPGLAAEQPASGRFVKTDRGYMVPYQATIPGTEATFEMQPIPGGKFEAGQPGERAGPQT